MLSHRIVLPLVLFSLTGVTGSAQSVISVNSGVIHYSEGTVLLDNQPVEHRFGRFIEMRAGSELRTEKGRAEILLTPDTFLRLTDNSAIRMVSNRLADTRVELLHGAAIIESLKNVPGTSTVITLNHSDVRFRSPGVYRFNAEPAEVRVDQGEATVLSKTNGEPVSIKKGYALALAAANATPEAAADADDALDSWSRRRSASVAASDAAAAQAEDMAVLLNAPPADPLAYVPSYSVFPYIPMIDPYPWGGFAGYIGSSRSFSPYYLPRLRNYPSLGYYGYPMGGYRSTSSGYRPPYRPISPIRSTSPVPFRPPVRVYSPTVTRPAGPVSSGGGARPGGTGAHR